jgi:hypothetical protein
MSTTGPGDPVFLDLTGPIRPGRGSDPTRPSRLSPHALPSESCPPLRLARVPLAADSSPRRRLRLQPRPNHHLLPPPYPVAPPVCADATQNYTYYSQADANLSAAVGRRRRLSRAAPTPPPAPVYLIGASRPFCPDPVRGPWALVFETGDLWKTLFLFPCRLFDAV